jgi:hypothetical protein
MHNKIFLFFVVVVLQLKLVAQHSESPTDGSLLIHFNNSIDEAAKKSALESSVQIRNIISVASQTNNGDIKIHIIFFDQVSFGILDLADPVAAEHVVGEWKEKYDSTDKRILFLFTRVAKDYEFHSLHATGVLDKGPLPKIVMDYISDNIVKNQSSVEESIKEGLNAIKNALDQRFKNALATLGVQMLSQSKYFKGNCYPSSLPYDLTDVSHIDAPVYYQFKLTENYTNWNEDVLVEYLDAEATPSAYSKEQYYYNGPFERLRTTDFDKTNGLLFGFTDKPIYGPGAKHIRLNSVGNEAIDPTPLEALFYYENDTKKNLNAPSTDKEYVKIIDGDKDAEIQLSAVRREFDAHSPSAYKSVSTKVDEILKSKIHFSTEHNRYNFCRVQMTIKRVLEGALLPQRALQLYYGGTLPTWCNTYAMDLLNATYEIEVLPWINADSMFNMFMADKKNFVPLGKLEDKEVKKLVDAGYPVIFSYTGVNASPKRVGHIEVGCPGESKLTTIGAGSKIGKKIWPDTSFGSQEIRDGVEKYLYLGYLIADYEN